MRIGVHLPQLGKITTLDQVSGGRLRLGLGVGWPRDEFDAAGADLRERGRGADEHA